MMCRRVLSSKSSLPLTAGLVFAVLATIMMQPGWAQARDYDGPWAHVQAGLEVGFWRRCHIPFCTAGPAPNSIK